MFSEGDRVRVNNSIYNRLGVLAYEAVGTIVEIVPDDKSKLWVQLDEEFTTTNYEILGEWLPVIDTEVEPFNEDA